MRKAFTLLEIVVVMALFGLIMGVVMVTFIGTGRRQAVEQAAEKIRVALVQARTNAVAGKKDCGVCGATGGVCGNGDVPLAGWEVQLDTSVIPVRYTVAGMCSAVPYPTPPVAPIYFLQSPQNLGVGVSVAGPASLLFRTANGGIYPDATTQYVITDSYGNARTITVTGGGEIQ